MVLTIELTRKKTAAGLLKSSTPRGALAYGARCGHAKAKAQAIALRVLADQLEHGETTGDLSNISF
jgi:hypothetical protein